VLRYLLRTLPLVRYTKSGHRRVPVGIDVLVRLNLKGSSDRRFYLQWSVYPRGAGGGRLLTWERNRIADVVKASGSTHLTHFWVPIPVQRHGYALHLRVLDEHGRAHDEQDASPSFH